MGLNGVIMWVQRYKKIIIRMKKSVKGGCQGVGKNRKDIIFFVAGRYGG